MDALFANLPNRYLLGMLALSALFFTSCAAFAAPVPASANKSAFRLRERLTLRPRALHFENVVAGRSYMGRVVFTNSGSSAVTISNVDRSNSLFSLLGVKVPFRIGPGESGSAEIGFRPTRSGRLVTDFIFATTHGERLVLRADGNGVRGGLVSVPAKLDFGHVRVGSGQRRRLTLANSGDQAQTVSRVLVSNHEFDVDGLNLPMTLEPGESVTFEAAFAPRTIGAAAGRITVDSRGVNLAIPIGGEGLGAAHLGAAPEMLNFGNVSAGTSSTLSGRLEAGRAEVTIYSAGITSPEFALGGMSFPLTIAACQSKSYQVTFSPDSSGSTSATLVFHSSTGQRTEETLSGNAVPRTGHKVKLSWNPGNAAVAGYNIYRANSSAGGYYKINPVPDSTTSYLDSTVQSGHTYFYVTTAISSDGKQSAFSNQLEVVIP